jgi:hypothetical protein
MTSRLEWARAVLCGLLAAGMLLACDGCTRARRPDSDQGGGASGLPKEQAKQPVSSTGTLAQSDENRTVLAVSQAIRRNKLTKLADECISYQFDGSSSNDDFLVDVRENHGNPKCGGDPSTAPRLFTVRVSRRTGEMATDAHSPSGEFHPLPR